MTRAFEKAGELKGDLLAAMAMPVETAEQKAAKVDAVKSIYDSLGVGEEAKQEIIRLNDMAMNLIAELGLEPEKAALLENYAKKLIGRAK